MLMSINPENPQQRLIEKAVKILKEGGVVAYPTDTIYGIGCNIFNKKAIERIYQLKQKDKRVPLSFICSDLKNISKYAHISTPNYKILRHFFPGPYTFILPGSRLVPKLMLTKRRTVGIRIPDNKICLMLLETFGNPIVSTSATTQNDEEILNDPIDIEQKLGKCLDLVIDGGISGFTASTVVDLTVDPPKILRVGKGEPGHFE